MSLPKLSHPMYVIEIPSTKKNHKFRPFLVKEEKLLLLAKESDTPSDILSAIKQVVNNCNIDNLNVDKLTIFDLEYIFIKLRSFSVDNTTEVAYIDKEDEKIYNFVVELDNIEVEYPEKASNIIKITETVGIIMKYPAASLYDDKEFLSLEKDYLYELIIRCVDKIYDGDNIYEAKDYQKSEISDFLDNLSGKTYKEVNAFLSNTPKVKHVIKYKNSLNHDREIVLSSLNDFFMWR